MTSSRRLDSTNTDYTDCIDLVALLTSSCVFVASMLAKKKDIINTTIHIKVFVDGHIKLCDEPGPPAGVLPHSPREMHSSALQYPAVMSNVPESSS